MSSISVRFLPFLSFFVFIFAWNIPLVSLIFLKRSLVFPILLFFSISWHWSLKKAFLSLLDIIWNFEFSLVYLSLYPLPFTSFLTHFAFLQFSFLVWTLSPPVQCYEPPSIVLQVFCLLDLISWIHMSLPLYNHKEFDLGDTWMT